MCTNLLLCKFHISSPATFGLFFYAVLPSFDAHHRFSYQHHSFPKECESNDRFFVVVAAPKKSNTPRPGSAGRARYNPASVYGVPVGRKSQNRSVVMSLCTAAGVANIF